MSKRLGKRERQLRRDQWELYRGLRARHIQENLAHLKDMPTSRGYTMTPDLKLGYAFHDPSNLPRISKFGMDGTKYGSKI